MNQRVLICAAMQMEAAAVARRLKLRAAGRGEWRGEGVRLVNVGIRAPGARKCFEAIEAGPELVIMAGIAGALDPTLEIGDVVREESAGEASGRIITVDGIVATPAEKAALFASSGCAAVDMETAVVRELAAARGAAFVAVRGISDRADEALDPRMATLVGPDGRPRMGRVFATLVCRPWMLGAMLRMGRSAQVACAAMAEAVEEIVARRTSAAVRG